MSDIPPDIPSSERNRKLLIGGGIAAFLVVGYLWWRNRQNANNSSSSTTGASSMDIYGGAAPGAGLLEPIVIQQPGAPSATSSATATAGPTPAGAPSPKQYIFQKVSGPTATTDIGKGIPLYYDPTVALGKGPQNITATQQLPLWKPGIKNVDIYQLIGTK